MARKPRLGYSSRKKNTGLEIGDTGTKIFDGIVRDEYNPKLDGTKGISVYDEMRRSDGTVKAALQAVKLPVRSASWYVTPGKEKDAKAEEIAEFVRCCLWEYMEDGFQNFLRMGLLALDYGVMPFEIVYGIRETEHGTRIVWDKLAPRMPLSIQKWAIAGGEFGITQRTSSGDTVEIPGAKLIVFWNEREGENYWGTSLLRAAYKPWYMKCSLEKIDAIAHERQGLGVPYAKLPEGVNTKQETEKAETILKNMRANSQAYLVEPHDYEIGFKDMKASTTRDPSNSLAYHSREIMKSMLVQFLELGSTTAGGTGGSRALSDDHSRLFLQAEEAIAQWFCDVMAKPIRELVDLNYGDVTEYPALDFEGITREDVKLLADTLNVLKTTGTYTPQDADETSMREKLGMPDLDENGIREDETQPDEEDDQNDNGKQASEHRHLKKKPRIFATPSGYRSWRKLTFAEEKVDFDALESKMDALESQFDTETKELLHEARDKYMATLNKAAHAGDTHAIKEATLKVQAEYARVIKLALQNAFRYGKNNAAKEIGAQSPPDPADLLRQIDIQADAIATNHIAQIEADSKNAYVQALNKAESLSVALAAADTAAREAIDALTSDTAEIVVSGYINHGRGVVFDKNADDIYALQRSEILDRSTCNYCLSIDGRVVEKDDSFASNTIFHSQCRGIWVAILMDEEGSPAIGGIPQSLRDRFGDVVNDLIQPKKPMPKRRK